MNGSEERDQVCRTCAGDSPCMIPKYNAEIRKKKSQMIDKKRLSALKHFCCVLCVVRSPCHLRKPNRQHRREII